jgi:Na+/melibiose symporter-like transporter
MTDKDDPFYHFNPLQFFLLFLILTVTHNWQHEFFHLVACKLFGGEAVVRIVMPFFATDISTWPTSHVQSLITVYAGGLGVALLCWFEWWTAHRDPEARIVFHAIGWSQALYGILEGTAYMLDAYQHVQSLGIIAMMIGTIYALSRSKVMWSDPTNP